MINNDVLLRYKELAQKMKKAQKAKGKVRQTPVISHNEMVDRLRERFTQMAKIKANKMKEE